MQLTINEIDGHFMALRAWCSQNLRDQLKPGLLGQIIVEMGKPIVLRRTALRDTMIIPRLPSSPDSATTRSSPEQVQRLTAAYNLMSHP